MNVVNNLDYIIKSFNENKMSHAFLIETNDVENCFCDLKKIIKMLNCEKNYTSDCTQCNLCYQIDNETLPNFINIIPDGNTIKKNQIIDLKEKMLTKPVFSKYNIYVISFAEKLNSSSANTMLKFIEEPEEKTIGFFLTENKENIIDTIRSRCQTICQYYENKKNNLAIDKLELIKDYINNIELDNKYALLYNKNIFLEKNYNREEIIDIFKYIFNVYEKVFLEEYDDTYSILYQQDKRKIENKLRIINRVIDDLNMNGNINLILDTFVIEMR